MRLFGWGRKADQATSAAPMTATKTAVDDDALKAVLIELKRAKGMLAANRYSHESEREERARTAERASALFSKVVSSLIGQPNIDLGDVSSQIADLETRVSNLDGQLTRRTAEAERLSGEVSKFVAELADLTDEQTAIALAASADDRDLKLIDPLLNTEILDEVDNTTFFKAETLATEAMADDLLGDETVNALKAVGLWDHFAVRPDQVEERIRLQSEKGHPA